LKKAVVIFSPFFNESGVENAIVRILRWVHQSPFAGYLVIPSGTRIHESWLEDIAERRIKILYSDETHFLPSKRLEPVVRTLCQYDEVVSISTALTSFLDSLYLESRMRADSLRSFLYFLDGEMPADMPRGFSARFRRFALNQFFGSMVRSRRLIFMDEYTRSMLYQYSEIKCGISEAIIIRLPIEVPPFSLEIAEARYHRKPKSIITFSRMDFP